MMGSVCAGSARAVVFGGRLTAIQVESGLGRSRDGSPAGWSAGSEHSAVGNAGRGRAMLALRSNPGPQVALIVVVDLAAVVLVVLAAADVRTVTGKGLLLTGILVLLGVAVAEQTRQVERRRQRYVDRPHVNFSSVWTFAGVLVLPLLLAAVVVVVIYAHLWWRCWYRQRGVEPYRLVFTAASVILGAHAATIVLRLGPADPVLVRHPADVAVLLLAAGVYIGVNLGLVASAVTLRDRRFDRVRALGTPRDSALLGATVGLGAVVAVLMTNQPALVLLVVPTMLVLYRVALLRQFEVQARTDAKTGLLNADAWYAAAAVALHRAQRDGTPVAVMMVDLDHFKAINDTYGHLSGDRVLRAVSELLRRTTRAHDLIGRFGGEEFVLLCPGADLDVAMRIAEQLRQRIRALVVPAASRAGQRPAVIDTMSASIGVAACPAADGTIHELVQRADEMLFVCKDCGRNRVLGAVVGAGSRIDGDGHADPV